MAKKHNWTTGPNNTVYDRRTHHMAADLIDHCPHLTPATEARIDNLLRQELVGDRNQPDVETKSVSEPDPEVVAAMNTPTGDRLSWMDMIEPSFEELLAIEQEAK